jgi:hypothetical protein
MHTHPCLTTSDLLLLDVMDEPCRVLIRLLLIIYLLDWGGRDWIWMVIEVGGCCDLRDGLMMMRS